jgi:hypothetical protein
MNVITLSESNHAKFIELPLHRAAAHVATEEAVTSPFKPDLEWRRILPSKRHEIDRPAKREGAILKCIGAPKKLPCD